MGEVEAAEAVEAALRGDKRCQACRRYFTGKFYGLLAWPSHLIKPFCSEGCRDSHSLKHLNNMDNVKG